MAATVQNCLIVGLGNPYCGDDAVGLLVARRVHAKLGPALAADLLELAASAFEVAERIAGYRRVILVDALIREEEPVGAVIRMNAGECRGQTLTGMHTAGLADALELGTIAGYAPPATITVYGIVIRQPLEFGERLSAELERQLPAIIETITGYETGTSAGGSGLSR
jgi:hydrogenase maturation protease